MIDRYTKIVLTIIACCLVYGVAKDFIQPASAQVGASGIVDVNIAAVGGMRQVRSSLRVHQ